jgi:hypothetical protein
MKSARIRLISSVLILLGIAGLVLGVVTAFGIGMPYRRVYEPGPIQIIGNDEEAWAFLQKDIIVTYPGWLHLERSGIALESGQEVIVFNSKGVRSRITVPRWKEVSFHPNSNRVFRQQEGFSLLSGSSLLYERSLFTWKEDHFQLIPYDASERFLTAAGTDDVFHPELDAITERNGWKHLYANHSLWSARSPFTWKGQLFELVVERNATVVKVHLRSLAKGEPWDAVLSEFSSVEEPLSRSEYNELRAHVAPGHLRPPR